MHTSTPRGKLVFDSFRHALEILVGQYETCDPIAVAVALQPEIVDKVIEKCCFIETKGKYTRGTVIVDWFEKYPHEKRRHPVKIVTNVKPDKMV